MVVNKTDLIKKMAEDAGITERDARKALESFTTSVEKALKCGDKVQIVGWGTFSVKERAARKGRNPATGAEIMIPASKFPVFKAGKQLKDSVKS